MCNWRQWIWPGLLAVAILTSLAGFLRISAVENDLSARAGSDLSAQHGWASIAANGRDLTLSGQAGSQAEIDDALRIVRSTNGVRVANSTATLPPLADPYLFSATKTAGKLLLEGNLTDAAAREQLIGAAKAALPEADIDDKMTLARGAPEGRDAVAAFALSQLAALADGRISMSGTDLTVEGTAANVGSLEGITDALSGGLPGGGKLASISVTPASASPYLLAISRDGDSIVLEGYAPDAAAREAVEKTVKDALPAATIDNQLQLAAGVPARVDYAAATTFIAAQIANLRQGKATLSNEELSVEGIASDADAFAAANAALAGALPSGINLTQASVRQPVIDPYTWSMQAGEKGVTLDGYVPDEQTATGIVDLARSLFSRSTTITSNLKTGEGAPDGFAQATSAAVRILSRLGEGRVDISGPQFKVGGDALTGVTANEIRAQVNSSLPAGFTGTAEVAVRAAGEPVDPAACQSLIDNLVADNTIQFESAKADIKADSFGLLDFIAFQMQRCPAQVVEIGGHTDSDGADDANLALSQSRADAVRDYLARAGVLFSRLQTKGFGESQPVAGNDTDDGKAKNRRIEFKITE